MGKIGLSVSFCIKDILLGNVKEGDVEKIIGLTSARDEEGWKKVIEVYRQSYWRDNPDEGEAILRRLLTAGKIEQPELEGKPHQNIREGIWQN